MGAIKMDSKDFIAVLQPLSAFAVLHSKCLYFRNSLFQNSFLKYAEPGTERFLRGRHFVISVLGAALLNV